MVGRTVQTLQRWDREGILTAHRTITHRRFYTHDQYLQIIGKKATEKQGAMENEARLPDARWYERRERLGLQRKVG